jgi:hypothetical protein
MRNNNFKTSLKKTVPKKLKCAKCGFVKALPQHYGKPVYQSGNYLVCWTGARYNKEPIPEHCGQQMILD